MNLFKGKKSPSDLVKSCKKHLSALLDEKNKDEKAMKKVSGAMQQFTPSLSYATALCPNRFVESRETECKYG
jgi:hypothetical protein